MLSHQKEQEERKSLAGSTGAMTYHSRASADIGLAEQGGRFKTDVSVTGATGVSVNYPRLPDNSPWAEAADAPGVEPSTGYCIDDVEPCGTEQEIRESISRARVPEPPASSPGGGTVTNDVVAPSSDRDTGAVTSMAAPTFRLRRL